MKEIKEAIAAIPQANVQGPLKMIVHELEHMKADIEELKKHGRKTKGKSKQKVDNASEEAGEGS